MTSRPRVRYEPAEKARIFRAFCAEVRRGVSHREAAARAGIPRHTIERWARSSPALADLHRQAMQERAAIIRRDLKEWKLEQSRARAALRCARRGREWDYACYEVERIENAREIHRRRVRCIRMKPGRRGV